MGKYFGTDGVRGIANVELTNELCYQLGRCGGWVLSKHMDYKPTIVIGKDPRLSSDMLEASLTAGILSVGCNVVHLGVLPTPAVAQIVQKGHFDAGIMISASHNSYEYNGIKFFDSKGLKLSDELEEEIEEYIDGIRLIQEPDVKNLGRILEKSDLSEIYLQSVKNSVHGNLADFRILVDCANGATSEMAKEIFNSLGVRADFIHCQPDGININHLCGSTHMESLAKSVVKDGYDIGFAFDGDGDRLLAVDSKGNEVDGDKIMTILATDLMNQKALTKDTLVLTVMSNIGVENALRAQGIQVYRTGVGDRYVLEYMLKEDLILGGEQSGHVIYRKFNTTGDGLLTAVQLLQSLQRLNKPIDYFSENIRKLPQVLVNVLVDPKLKDEYNQRESLLGVVKKYEKMLGSAHRLLIRASGTEPLIRVMIEGEDQKYIEKVAEEIGEIFRKELEG